MTLLSVNLNKIALVRNARDTDEPDILAAARTCVEAGAGGITVHPRPDRRHTRPADVLQLADLLRGESNAEFALLGAPTPVETPDGPSFIAVPDIAVPEVRGGVEGPAMGLRHQLRPSPTSPD